MGKKLIFLVVLVLAAALALGLAKDMIARVAVEKGVEVVTGLPLKMKSLNVGLVNTVVGIKDLRLFNPEGYRDRVMLNMPEIYVNYDLPAIIKGKIHLEEVRIDLKEFVVVKNEKGELNLDALKAVQAQKEGKKPEEKEKGKAPEIQIDSLRLKIGKVLYKDYSAGGAPSVREFDINLDEKYQNINDLNKLVSLIVVKALMNTTIAKLTDFDLRGLEGTIGDTLATAERLAGVVGGEVGQAVTTTTREAREAVKTTVETLKKTTEGLEKVIKLPFGAKEE